MKRLLIGKIIGFIGLILFVMVLSYVVTLYLEKDKFEDINLLVTFEDTKYFELENTSFLEKEEVSKTYPYIFEIENKGITSVNYQIEITDLEISNLTREDLDYILILDSEEVKTGTLSEIDNNILYSSNIKTKKTGTYKLYIYLNKEKEDVSYKYSLEVKTL